MMNVLVISFVVCMMPIKTKQLLEMLWPRLARPCTLTGHYIEASIHFICHWLGMAHSFVNPIIYSFMSLNFRVRKLIILSVNFSMIKILCKH